MGEQVTRIATRVRRMPITKARVHLGALVRGVHLHGDVVVLEKHGIPIAGLVDIDVLEDYLEADDAVLQRKLRQSMKAHRSGRSRPLRELLEELNPNRRRR